MAAKSSIEWLDGGATWNPIRARVRKDAVAIAHAKGYTSLYQILTGVKSDGATPRVVPGETWGYHCEVHSTGCTRCYACTMNGRTLPAWGTGLPYDRRSRDLIEIYLDEDELVKPFHWKRDRRVFPCSMTDLFGDFVPFEFIDRIFGVMALTPNHTYECLTKRADRMVEYLTGQRREGYSQGYIADCFGRPARWFPREFQRLPLNRFDRMPWPLPNVWVGFSAEDQDRFNQRWVYVERLAKERWFTWSSLEPLLGPIDVSHALIPGQSLNYAVTGGESGPHARPCNVQWLRQLIREFRAAKVPLFVKQAGSIPVIPAARQNHYDWGDAIGRQAVFSSFEGSNDLWRIHLNDRKGGNPYEWAKEFRVRDLPVAR